MFKRFHLKIMKTMIQRYIYVYIEITKKNCRLVITNKRKNTLNSRRQEDEAPQEDQ